jgi:hypothetical protein
VNALAMMADTTYFGGTFSAVDGQPRSNLASILPDGGLGSWAPTTNNAVNSLGTSGAVIYVGGNFTDFCGHSWEGLGAADVNGSTTWDPQPVGAVHSIAVTSRSVFCGGNVSLVVGGVLAEGFGRLRPVP